MKNQFGIFNFWQQGDWITHLVALLLLGMSVLSWIVIIMKTIDILRLNRMGQRIESFWLSKNLDEGLAAMCVGSVHANVHNPFYRLAKKGHESSLHQRATQNKMREYLDLSDWVTRGLKSANEQSAARLQGGLAILASIGSTSPFVGLFGTVWGIYHALISIGGSDQMGMDHVAGPIGEALIMTALGLVVAVPAVLGYNALLRGNKFILNQLNSFSNDLHDYLVSGARIGQLENKGV